MELMEVINRIKREPVRLPSTPTLITYSEEQTAIWVEIITTTAEAEVKGFTLGHRGDNRHPPGWRICGSV